MGLSLASVSRTCCLYFPIPLAPSTFNRFACLVSVLPASQTLGRGSFGVVTLVQNRIDGRLYAIKRIHLSTNDQKSAHLQRILREVTSLSRLHHENVLRYFSCWIEGGAVIEEVDAASAVMHSTAMGANAALPLVAEEGEFIASDADEEANDEEYDEEDESDDGSDDRLEESNAQASEDWLENR